MKNRWFIVISAADVFQGEEFIIDKIVKLQEKLADTEWQNRRYNPKFYHQPIGVFEKPGKATDYFHHMRSDKMDNYSIVMLGTSKIDKEIIPVVNGVQYE